MSKFDKKQIIFKNDKLITRYPTMGYQYTETALNYFGKNNHKHGSSGTYDGNGRFIDDFDDAVLLLKNHAYQEYTCLTEI